MDISDYLPMFLAEGREHLQNLNLALVRLEQDQKDGETTNEIFRIAHSLKGMSATMGFSRMAALTHEMENVLELLRQSDEGLPHSALNVLFSCLDCLEEMTGEIESAGTESTDPEPLLGQLRALKEPETAEAAPAPKKPARRRTTRKAAAPKPEVVAEAPAVETTGHKRVVLTVAADCDMPSVRVFLALQALGAEAEIVSCDPPQEEIEQATSPVERVVVVVAGEADDATLRKLLRNQEGIDGVTVENADGAAEAPKAERRSEPRDAAEAVTGPPASAPAADPAAPVASAPHPARRQTVRVDAERLDMLMHLMGEMVVQRTRLESIAHESGNPQLAGAVGDLARVAQSLQAMVMQVRMVPVESVFMRFPRMVRDLAAKLDKQVDLHIQGEDTELDRTVVEALGDPLVHLIRNALDHGLETPEQRQAVGKPATGTLEITAEHAGGDVVITVRDDGRGVNARKVAEIAAKRGLIEESEIEGVDVEAAIELLFAPGFSTAEVATDVSGRGVGMDAVRSMVRNLGGDASMKSVPGEGSCATLRLPLTLAILPALLVDVDGSPFALPLDRVEQAIRIADYSLRSVNGQYAITLREKILPLFDLGECLGYPGVDPSTANAVVVRSRDKSVGLIVGRLIGQQELVTRPLPAVVEGTAAVSGGAVLGDGQIALIVDCDEIVRAA
jgi:two-component system, chemotaxis family, sensor kinase CheA